jgi:hypothetical protein
LIRKNKFGMGRQLTKDNGLHKPFKMNWIFK